MYKIVKKYRTSTFVCLPLLLAGECIYAVIAAATPSCIDIRTQRLQASDVDRRPEALQGSPGPQLAASQSEYLLGSQLLQNVGTHCWATQPIL